ncbi:MAG: hypothetical protein R2823_04625 [Acidimicrobiia bacterium]
MKRIIASVVAAGVLVTGAVVAASVISSPASAQDDGTTTEQADRPDFVPPLEQALSDLVDDGTITQAQADTILETVKAKREELREKRPGWVDHRRRHMRRHLHRQIADLLEDGVISADEIADLPERHPFRNEDGPFAELLEDGQITQAEWDAFIAQRKAEHEDRKASAEQSVLSA